MTENLEEIAVSKFKKGFNCSQSVLFAFAKNLNLDEGTALNISSGFGAGMGRMQEICGAVTGAFMVIGLKYGKSGGSADALKEKIYSKVREFAKLFQEKHTTVNCRLLLNGCDLLTDEGRNRYNNESLKDKVCELCVRDSIKILNRIL